MGVWRPRACADGPMSDSTANLLTFRSMSTLRAGARPVDLNAIIALAQDRDAPMGRRVEALNTLALVAKGQVDTFEPDPGAAKAVALKTLQTVAARMGDHEDFVKAALTAADGLASVQTQSGDAATEQFLMRTLPRPNAQWEIINDLAARGDAPAQKMLVRAATEHPHASVRHEALKALGRLAAPGDGGPRQALRAVVKNESAQAGDRIYVLELVAQWSRPGLGLLLAGAEAKNATVQRRAVELLGPHAKDPSVRDALGKLAAQTPSADLKQLIQRLLAG